MEHFVLAHNLVLTGLLGSHNSYCSLQVYLPCVLQSKKRYVGLSYESPDQATPTFDAKGIETVRRDNCPAVGKVRFE